MADLVSLAEYKSYKGISNPNKDAMYQTVLTSVSDLIKTYCGRTFIDHYSTPKVEKITVTEGTPHVVLREHPLILVSAVTQEGVDITADIDIDVDLGVIYYPTGFTAGADILEVTYTAGYAATPADLKLAAMELVDYYVNDEHKARKTFGGSSIEYETAADSWPWHIKSVLNMHRDL